MWSVVLTDYFLRKDYFEMSKGSLTILFMLWMVSCGFGEVLFEQDFSQPPSGDPSKVQMRIGSLDYPFDLETGNRLYIKDYNAGVKYPVASGLTDPASHQTLYISFCLRSDNQTTKEKFAGVLFYQDDREICGAGNDYHSEQFSFWKSDGQCLPIGEVPVHVDSEIHKVVIRIDLDAAGPETIKIGLDPLCRRNEARQPDHIWSTYEMELAFDEIRIRSGNTDCAWEFDELRIGTTWDSVIATDDKPGELVESLLADSLPAGQSEMLHDGVARFWPAGLDPAGALPSFALESPCQAIGSVSSSWKMKPRFGIHGNEKYAYISLSAETDLYGTGEVTGSLLRNGYKIVLFNKDNYAYGKPDQLYQSHPWVLGVRPDGSAFGVLFDTPWKAELSLRSGILFTVSDQAPPFPVFIIEGENPPEVMAKLAKLTGTISMPPRWALGYHQCRYSYHPDVRAREIVDLFRAKRIPCDVLWFDIDYMKEFRIFTFDPNEYPDPKATNDYLHAQGFKSVWMIDPGVKHEPGYSVYDNGTAIDAWVKDAAGNPFVGPVWPGDCVFPDFTIPAVRQWWGQLYKAFMAKGIDGVWNDMNEPAVFNDKTNWTMPLDNWHRGGGDLPAGPHEQYHNVYGLLMVKSSREGIQKANPDKRPFVLSRANFLGGHRYAATWTGDNKASWQHLKWSIPMSLNLSLSGQPLNGPDIGGFVSDATPELWANWISVGAFYPFSRAHTSTDTSDQEPWTFGQATENAARTALQQRYRLMPYIYTLFQQSHLKGLPVMQPVFFADPADLSLRMEDQAFLLGRDLLVIPAWAQNTQLPGGIWREISLLPCEANRDEYQCTLKLRGGAILPVGPVIQSTEEITDKPPLELIVVLDQNGAAEGSLYEDAGDGYGFRREEYRLSQFRAQKQRDQVRVKCTNQKGTWALEKRLVSVTVIDGQGMHHGFGDIVTGVKVMLAQ